MKKCADCKKFEGEVEFTTSRKYQCKNYVRIRNKKYSESIGCKLRFIPEFTDTHKQCCICKVLKPLEDYSPAKRGRLGKSFRCKPCASKYQIDKHPKEVRRAKTQKYRDNNREWWRSLHRIAQFNRRQLTKANSDDTVTPDFVKNTYELGTCYYCEEYTPKKFRTLDHKNPLIKGGFHSVNNIVMACLSCNMSKGTKTEEEFKIYNNNKTIN